MPHKDGRPTIGGAAREPLKILKRTGRAVLGQAGVLDLLYPRRFHAYCCGAAKTGTHSIRAIFHGYRAAHEVDIERTLRLAVAYCDRSITAGAAARAVGRRDRSLWLEMDSSPVNGVLVRPIVEALPDALVILTIRDAYSWANSCFDHQVNISVPDLWYQLDRRVMGLDNTPHSRWDAPLEERGLYPLACYFRRWTEHNEAVLEAVPEDRLLVVRTDDIAARIADIAAFVGVPVATLEAGNARSYAAPKKHRILARLDSSYVRETAERCCGDLMKRFFPDVPPYEPT
ncbi:MAG: sulfotransferase [Geminicoccales bacterium]